MLSSPSVPEGPGRFPPLDTLKKTWTSFRRREVAGDELGEVFNFAERAFAEMESHLRTELQLRPLTPEALELVPGVLTHFDRVSRLFVALAMALEAGDWVDGDRKLERLERAMGKLHTQLDRLADFEKERPELSPSPYIDQLLHTAYGVLEERLPPTSLQIRAAALLEHFDGLMEQIEPRLEALSAEGGTEMEELLEAVELATEGLELLTQEGLETEAVLAAMEDVRVAGESLEKVRLRVQNESGPKPLACPRCGHAYESGDRHCGACHAVLPAVVAEGGPTSSFQVEVGANTGEGPRRVQVANLLQVLDRVLQQQAVPDELLRAVELFEKKLGAGLGELERLPPPAEDAPPEHKEAIERTATDIEAGLETFSQGLAALRDFADSGEPRYAEAGRQTILQAEAELDAILSQGEQALAQNRSRPSG